MFDEARDEVLRKLGRNLLLFQQAENRLKWLAARRQVAGMSGDFQNTVDKTLRAVSKETLGGALRRVTEDSSLSERDLENIEGAIVKDGGAHLELSFDFLGPEGEPDVSWQERLEALVEARNGLVHHFLDQFDLETPEGCRAAGRHLDQQEAEHAPVVADLGQRCKNVTRSAGLLTEALKHDDIRAEFRHGSLWLKLDEVLRRVAKEGARNDGWTHLSLVGQELATHEAGLLQCMRESFGHRSLREAVAVLDQFEMRDESTGNGAKVLYRCR